MQISNSAYTHNLCLLNLLYQVISRKDRRSWLFTDRYPSCYPFHNTERNSKQWCQPTKICHWNTTYLYSPSDS